MVTNTATLSFHASQSIEAACNFTRRYGAQIGKTMTLTVGAAAEGLQAPPGVRYPNCFVLVDNCAAARAEMLAAAASAFEFWLNEDDSVYEEQ